jgi:transposase
MKISKFNRGYMKAMDNLGVSGEEIVNRMNVSRSTFYRLKQNGFQYDEKSAGSPLLDSDEEYAFINASEANRDLTPADLTRNSEINKKGVSVDTVERIFNKYGLKCRRKRKMQQMTEDNKADRFSLLRNYRRWSKQRLQKIFYSDESLICLKQNGVQFVRKYDDEDWNDERFR